MGVVGVSLLAIASMSLVPPRRARSERPSELVGHALPTIRTRPIVPESFPGSIPRDVNPRDHVGHPMLLWVFATWCGNCRAMEPSLRRLHARFSPAGVRFLAISVEARQTLHRRYRAHPVPWRVGQTTGHAVHQLNATSLPTYLLVDRESVVRGTRVGGGRRTARALERGLEALVGAP